MSMNQNINNTDSTSREESSYLSINRNLSEDKFRRSLLLARNQFLWPITLENLLCILIKHHWKTTFSSIIFHQASNLNKKCLWPLIEPFWIRSIPIAGKSFSKPTKKWNINFSIQNLNFDYLTLKWNTISYKNHFDTFFLIFCLFCKICSINISSRIFWRIPWYIGSYPSCFIKADPSYS